MGYNSDDWGSDDFDSVDSGTDPSSAAASTSESYDSGNGDAQAAAAASANYGFGGKGKGADPRNEVDDTGGYSLTYEQARVAGLPAGRGDSQQSNVRMVNGIPVETRSPVSFANPNYRPLDRDLTKAELDKALAKAKADYDKARADAYSEKQFGAKFNKFVDPFGIYGNIYDALLDPKAALANRMAERGYATLNGFDVGEYGVPSNVANYNPQGLNLATAGGPLSEGGRVAAYDPQTNSVYDSSPFSGLNPFGAGVPQSIQELYDRRNQIEAERRAYDGGDDPLLIPEVAEIDPETGEPTQFPQFTPSEYKYQPYTAKFYSIPSRFTQPYGLLG
jgi:hypothetical protein